MGGMKAIHDGTYVVVQIPKKEEGLIKSASIGIEHSEGDITWQKAVLTFQGDRRVAKIRHNRTKRPIWFSDDRLVKRPLGTLRKMT